MLRKSGARFGLPAAERAAKLAELDQSIGDLETAHTELVDGAGEVGISLPLLDTVRDRREDEARTGQRAAELERQRSAGVYPVNV